ncbi:MAG: hypothetical protein ACYDBB_26925 [Armatimonadota bacterium]
MALSEHLLPVASYETAVQQADQLLAARRIHEARAAYQSVADSIQRAWETEQRSSSLWGAVIGGILGCLIPSLQIVTIPLGVYLGYKAGQGSSAVELTDSPYFAVYRRAVEGVLACVAQRRRSW